LSGPSCVRVITWIRRLLCGVEVLSATGVERSEVVFEPDATGRRDEFRFFVVLVRFRQCHRACIQVGTRPKARRNVCGVVRFFALKRIRQAASHKPPHEPRQQKKNRKLENRAPHARTFRTELFYSPAECLPRLEIDFASLSFGEAFRSSHHRRATGPKDSPKPAAGFASTWRSPSAQVLPSIPVRSRRAPRSLLRMRRDRAE